MWAGVIVTGLNLDIVRAHYYFFGFSVPIFMISLWVVRRDYKRFQLYLYFFNKFPGSILLKANTPLTELPMNQFKIHKKGEGKIKIGLKTNDNRYVLDYQERHVLDSTPETDDLGNETALYSNQTLFIRHDKMPKFRPNHLASQKKY